MLEAEIGVAHVDKVCSPETLAALNGHLPRERINAIVGGVRSQRTVETFRSALRGLVDAWIESGRGSNGVDCPRERAVRRNVQFVLLGYSKRNAVRWNYRDGRLRIYATLRSHGNQEQDAFDAAALLFILLLDSPGRARLARCDDCGTYFLRRRTPKKDTPIKRGSFCPEHKGKGSAKRTEKSRESRKNELIKRAADLWLKWKPARRYGKRSVWVADMVNQDLPDGAEAITGKWVTQNQQKIEAEAEGRNHAKS